jgi:parvulin-like peptidyl-prolyl isomerase
MPTGAWQGPVASSYGLHLVLVNARTEPGPPLLSEVREVVVRDWMREQLALQNDKYYERLRARYTIRIQSPRLAAAQ